jgi:predicted nucleotidyltransferase
MLRPEESFHVREIARLTGVEAGNALRELNRLHGAGLVSSSRVGNQVRYQADTNSPIFSELASIMRKTAGLADVLRDALQPLQARIATAFVYGSVAKGKETRHSDIDLMVIGDVDFEDVVVAAHPASVKLGREVSSIVMKPVDFRRKLAAKERFVMRVVAEPKILLLGALDES